MSKPMEYGLDLESDMVYYKDFDDGLIMLVEKQVADKMADHLELAIAGIRGANVDVKFLENRLKTYRGTQ